jgi:hypothetical protein
MVFPEAVQQWRRWRQGLTNWRRWALFTVQLRKKIVQQARCIVPAVGDKYKSAVLRQGFRAARGAVQQEAAAAAAAAGRR